MCCESRRWKSWVGSRVYSKFWFLLLQQQQGQQSRAGLPCARFFLVNVHLRGGGGPKFDICVTLSLICDLGGGDRGRGGVLWPDDCYFQTVTRVLVQTSAPQIIMEADHLSGSTVCHSIPSGIQEIVYLFEIYMPHHWLKADPTWCTYYLQHPPHPISIIQDEISKINNDILYIQVYVCVYVRVSIQGGRRFRTSPNCILNINHLIDWSSILFNAWWTVAEDTITVATQIKANLSSRGLSCTFEDGDTESCQIIGSSHESTQPYLCWGLRCGNFANTFTI